jgi:uncharacterized protein (TIGR03437 family)
VDHKLRDVLITGLLIAASAANLRGAPKLRLAQTALTPASIAQGSNGPTQSVEARNAGDGALSLQVSSSVSWLVPTIGAARTCVDGNGSCLPIQIALQTASLAKGTYTGFVTVNDPNAIDAPQTIAVTVQIGGNVPDKLEYFLPLKGTASTSFTTASAANVSATTQTGGGWLSVAQDGVGTFRFNVPYRVTASAGSLAASDYSGTVTVSGSSLAAENKTIPVTLHVTTQPIAQVPGSPVMFRIAQGGAKQNVTIPVANAGQGTLTVSTVTASTTSGGTFLTAQAASPGPGVALTIDPTGLSPGVYLGTVAVASNAANSTVNIPIELDVLAPSGPISKAGGVVNNATFMAGESVAQGDIVALFGDQLISGDALSASSLPLGSTLGGAQVFVNDKPVPVYFVSPGQINFQIPYDAAVGDGTVRVERGGQRGNTVSVNIARSVPRLLRLNIGDYGIIVNQDNSFPIPATPGLTSHPAKAGDALTIYAIGLGPTSPAVVSGVAAPSAEPFARVTNNPQVCFGAFSPFNPGTCVDPLFAGLTPGFVGLYQVNVVIPAGVQTGDTVAVRLVTDDGESNAVQIAIQ